MDDKKEYEIECAVGEINRCWWKANTFHLTIRWEAKGIGIGELTFYYNTEDETWECDSENMSDEFCKAVLDKWFEGDVKRRDERI